MCCAMVRENRRSKFCIYFILIDLIFYFLDRMININQRNIPMSTERDNLIEQCSQHDHYSLPPPYTSETTTNFEESLPSYERAINRHS